MKKRILVLLMGVMMVVISVAPAFADSGRPRRAQPTHPPGLEQSGVDRPDQAPNPETGKLNIGGHFQ